MEFFEHLEPLLKTFWFIAIPTSLVFLIQTVMTFIGADASDGLDVAFDSDHHDSPFQLYSLRNLINFLLGFSWTGISFYNSIRSAFVLTSISIAVGILFVYLFFILIKQIHKLSEDNSFKFSNTLNKTAEVYLNIPAHKNGKGKVLISVNGSIHELDAMTEHESIPNGSIVIVERIEGNNILIVKTI